MTPYVFTIPVVPPSLNVYTRLHWSKQKKLREEFQEQVWASINEHGNRCPRGLEKVELHAVIQFPDARRRDSDNFGATLWKLVQDVLVRDGVIPDDSHDRCTAHPPKLMVGRKPLTVVTLEAAA